MKRIGFLIALVLVVVVGWTAAWFWLSGEIRRNVVALAEADGVTSPRVTCDTLNIAGFPFRFDLTCAGAAVTSGDVTAKVAELRATVLVYRPTHALAFAKAPILLDNSFTGQKSRLDFTDMEMSARLDGWRIARISVIADALRWTDTVFGETLLAETDHAEVQILDIPEQHDAAKGLAALATYTTFTGLKAPLITVDDANITLEAELTAVPDDVRNFGDPALLQRFIANAGKLNLVSLRGEDGEASFDGSGSFALNASGTLDGKLALASKGVVDRIEQLFPGSMNPIVVGSAAADGTYTQNFAIAGGVIYAGIIPLGVIPPVQ